MSTPLIDLACDNINQNSYSKNSQQLLKSDVHALKTKNNCYLSNDPFELAVHNSNKLNQNIRTRDVSPDFDNNVPTGNLISIDSEFNNLDNNTKEQQQQSLKYNLTKPTNCDGTGKPVLDATFDDLSNTMPKWVESDNDSDNENSLPLLLLSPPPQLPPRHVENSIVQNRLISNDMSTMNIMKKLKFNNSTLLKEFHQQQMVDINKSNENNPTVQTESMSSPEQSTESKKTPLINKLSDNCINSIIKKQKPLETVETLFQSLKLAVEECDSNVDRDKAFILLDKLQNVLIGANQAMDNKHIDITQSPMRRQGTFNLDQRNKDTNNIPEIHLLNNNSANNTNEGGTSSNLASIVAKLEVLVENNVKLSNNTPLLKENNPPPPPRTSTTTNIQLNIQESKSLRYSMCTETNLTPNRPKRLTNSYVPQNHTTQQKKSLVPPTEICQKNIKLRCGSTSFPKTHLLKTGKQSQPPLRATVAMTNLTTSIKNKSSLMRSPLQINQKSNMKYLQDSSMVNKVQFSPNYRQFATPNPKRISSNADNLYKRRRSLSEIHTAGRGLNTPGTPTSTKSKNAIPKFTKNQL